eukprot:CAMPEP_0179197628 /NCGR_PEP_ID=MMETSP0796-20121207/98284_1 /TAXON_ID=73915 /ORGANISM="Pyrodinium bahamense, Strain pbaha01" /LENGTH=43 /DNA_ID= /DNA_START= /DNA_END= /DNA_ORIENTATION=
MTGWNESAASDWTHEDNLVDKQGGLWSDSHTPASSTGGATIIP